MAALFPAADCNPPSPFGLLPQPAERIGFLNSEKNMLLESPRYDNLTSSNPAVDIDGILHVTIHHANNIHNICIYGNQDVYAKFSITHCQDAVYSTQPVKAGGKNPVFNQSLQIPVSRPDSVLKCEIWMMSCLRTYLQDQLLGFVLVSLGGLFEKGKQTRDYSLTSTDLFYTPAGTVSLSLLFHSSSSDFLQHEVNSKISHDSSLAPGLFQSSPDVSMDCRQKILCHDDLNKVEFPDLDAVSENQTLVSLYLKMAAGDVRDRPESNRISFDRNQEQYEDELALENRDLSGAPFLQLGASHPVEMDCEMSSCSGEEISSAVSLSRNSHFLNPASQPDNGSVEAQVSSRNVLSSSAIELSEVHADGSTSFNPTVHNLFKHAHSATSSSLGGGSGHSSVETEKSKVVAFSIAQEREATAITASLLNASVETDVPVIQQQIVDLYLKSMHQFTEKLADMKLPMDVSGPDMAASKNMKLERASVEEGKTDAQKLFYGSRAFF